MSAVNTTEETAAMDLGAFLDAGDGAVVTLEAGETRLAAHRAVLAARSPVFAALFQHDMLESSSGVVSITDIEGPVLRQLLCYCYTLQAPQLPAMAPHLLAAADKYGLSALKDACEQQVAAQLAVETAAASAVLAVRHSCANLTAAAVAVIKAHDYQVMGTRGWAEAMKNQPDDLIAVSRLLDEPPAKKRKLATIVGRTTRQSYRDHSQTPASAAAPTAACHTAPPDYTAVSRYRKLVTILGRTTRESYRDHSQTPASAAAPAAACHTAPPDCAAVSRYRSLSGEEKGVELILKASFGSVGEVQALLAAGADVRARDPNRNTALHEAVRRADTQKVRLLLAAGADVRARNSYRSTALHNAGERGSVKVARLLLEAGAEMDARNKWQKTPLHLAATSGRTDVVQLLLASAANANARDSLHRTPLHCAAERGHVEVVAALLEAGADKGARDKGGKSPLDVARQDDQQEVIELLT